MSGSGRKRFTLLEGFAYAACTWSFVFAAASFYWALGGTFLSNTQSPQILELSAEPWFVAVVWLTGLLKVLAGVLALSLVQCRGGGKRFRGGYVVSASGVSVSF